MKKPSASDSTLAALSESQMYRDYESAFTQGTKGPKPHFIRAGTKAQDLPKKTVKG